MSAPLGWIAAALAASGVMTAAASLAAAAGRPLPPLQLVSPSGAVVTDAAFANEDRWLLVYVAPDCGSCDRLLAALTGWRATLPADRVAIVVAGQPAAARAYAEAHAIDAAGFAWYADAAGAGARAIGAMRLPTLAGVGGGELSWSISGVLNQPGVIEPTIRSWLVP